MPTVTYTTEVDVDVDLDDIDADDLASALEDKGYFVIKNDKDIEKRLIDQLGFNAIAIEVPISWLTYDGERHAANEPLATIGTQVGREIVRGVLGSLLGGRRR